MNRIIITLFCIFSYAASNAQIHEIGIFAGGNNYIGDVGPTNYVKPNEFAFGLLYKWNKARDIHGEFPICREKLLPTITIPTCLPENKED